MNCSSAPWFSFFFLPPDRKLANSKERERKCGLWIRCSGSDRDFYMDPYPIGTNMYIHIYHFNKSLNFFKSYRKEPRNLKTVHQFYMVGPRNRLQLRNTGYLYCFSSARSLWPLRSIYSVTEGSNRAITVTGGPFWTDLCHAIIDRQRPQKSKT